MPRDPQRGADLSAGLATWLAACLAGGVLSLKSVAVLDARSRWTAAGWWFTLGYFALAGYAALSGVHFRLHPEYWCLAGLTLAFAGAGLRDEPQSEPWWWPTRPSTTRRERRAGR